ncbi:MAG: ABC transporter substrate-binding protein [Cellvibrionaceae bacterium]
MTNSKIAISILLLIIACQTNANQARRIAIVSSYHPEFLWTSETNQGVINSLLEQGYLNNQEEADKYTQNDYLETDKVVLKKWWMDSKRKNTLPEIQREITRIVNDLEGFDPDIVLTGDDNATNYIGNYYVDSETPLVFWGVNGNPMKYGLLDSLIEPGRNVTGVYQAGYIKESVLFLKYLLPEIKTMTILADESVTSRAKVKKITRLSYSGELPIQVVTTITSNNLESWKEQALHAASYTDAFYMLNHNTLKDKNGKPVNSMEIGAWYLRNIKKPEISDEEHFIIEGMLAAVSDSGVRQGYQAMNIAIRIMKGEKPSTIAVTAPKYGDYVVNKERAKMLGVYEKIKNREKIESWIDEALALKNK